MENTAVDNEDEGVDKTAALEDVEVMETPIIGMKIKIEGEVKVKEKGSLQKIEEEVKIIVLEGDKDNGMVMTQVTVTETIGTEIMTGIIMETEVGDGMAIEDKGIVIEEGVGDGTQILNILNKNTHSNHNTLIRIIIGPLQWVVNTNIKCHMSSTYPTHNCNSSTHRDHRPNRAKQQIYVNCVKIKAIMTINAIFAGDFMAQTQKVFNQGRSYNQQDPEAEPTYTPCTKTCLVLVSCE